MLAGKAAHYQRYDGATAQLAEWITVPAASTVIIEGFGALRPQFRQYVYYGIWVNTPPKVRLTRGLARGHEDAAQWRLWQQSDQEYLNLNRPDMAASLIIDGTTTY
ncbi:hypothetical protein HJC99_00040 [Candidatus Saccharibacteria bacterium]|nr:hypothetical protein [Candidatus Saccharibacteria bacterium]